MDARFDKKEQAGTFDHLKNEAAVAGHVLADLPGALWSEVSADVRAQPTKRALESLTSAALSAALVIGARRAPIVTRDASMLLGGSSAIAAVKPFSEQLELAVSGTKTLFRDAWNADDAGKREALGNTYAHAIGKDVAPFTEIAVAGSIGGLGGRALLGKASADAWISSHVTEGLEYSWRRRTPLAENYLLKSRGSFSPEKSLLNSDGTANLLNLNDSLNSAPRTFLNRSLLKADPHIEEARLVDLQAGRISAPVRGTLTSTEFGFEHTKLSSHTHPEFLGARPSVSDVTGMQGVHMIKSGDDIAVFLGQREQYRGVSPALDVNGIFAERGAPRLTALVINPKTETAKILTGEAIQRGASLDAAGATNGSSLKDWGWSETIPQYVDYKASAETLSRIHVNAPERAAAQIKALADKSSVVPHTSLDEILADLRKLGGGADH